MRCETVQGNLQFGNMNLLLSLVVVWTLPVVFAEHSCEDAKHPVIILPGIMASQINATYSGLAARTPCLGRKRMHTVWPPTAKSILPTGLRCWMYMVQPAYSARSKRFGNARGVRTVVEPGGPSGTEYGLWQSSYTNLTDYLAAEFGYTLGKDMFGAPFDWRLHITGLEKAGEMKKLAAKVEAAVEGNCGKKAVMIGHSMGGLVSFALLHRDPRWTSKYIQGLVTVSSPFGGTTDQAIAVRMGAVDFNINDWVKMPMAGAAKEVKELHSADVAVEAASLAQDVAAGNAELMRAADAELLQAAAMDDGGVVAIQQPPLSAAAKAKAKASQAAVATASFFNVDKMISNYISSIFYKATFGLPGLSMLLPYDNAYGSNRRIIVTSKETYTTSMMQKLMQAIGDEVTDEAWKQVHELDRLLSKGSVPGIPTHCLYAVGKDTTLTWRFPNIRERKPLLTSTPLVKTGGDGTVSMQSLKQCFRITEPANITELGDYGHLEVLKDRDTLQQLGYVLTTITGQQPGSSSSVGARPTANGSAVADPYADITVGVPSMTYFANPAEMRYVDPAAAYNAAAQADNMYGEQEHLAGLNAAVAVAATPTAPRPKASKAHSKARNGAAGNGSHHAAAKSAAAAADKHPRQDAEAERTMEVLEGDWRQ